MKKNKFRRLLTYYRPYRKILFLDLVLTILSSLVVLVIPLIVKYVTDNVLTQQSNLPNREIGIFVAIIGVLLLIYFMCTWYVMFYGHLMGAMIEADMRSDMFKHYQKLSLQFFDNQKVGRLMSRMTNDLFYIGEFLHHAPEQGLELTLRIVGTVTIIFLTNKILALVTIALLVVILAYICKSTPKLNSANRACNEKMSEINAEVEESLSNIRVVKAFAQSPLEVEKFEKRNQRFVAAVRKAHWVASLFHSVNSTLIMCLIPLVTAISILLIGHGLMSLSDLLMYILYADLLIGPMYGFIEMLDDFYKYYIGYARFTEILEIEPKIKNLPDSVELKDVCGKIEFRNVTFSYSKKNQPQSNDSGTSEVVLKNFNLTINPGEYVALVGASGVGKSTICNLLLRFYEVDEGEILIDGKNIREFTLESLRKSISFVQQETFLFAGSVMENIRYGKIDATDEEVVEAAKRAHAHDFIMAMPEGYNTHIGQKAFKISGGQKQRLSIARFFLKNSPIFVLDEATSSLDNESEKIVHKSFERLAKNRTTIVIAHRLSTVKNAKRIVVLTKDGIAEEGTHEELIEKKGVYYGWYKLI